jgi:hypothetical protein
MKTRIVNVVAVCTVCSFLNAALFAESVSFTGADIKAAVGDLSDSSYQWGLWAVRARPVVPGGSFTITGATTGQAGWETTAPSTADWSTYGTNCAWFADVPGSEAGNTAANPVYMIMDVSDSNWWSSAFDEAGSWVDDWAPGPDGVQGTTDDLGTFYSSGYDNGSGGTNVITAVSDSATYSFDFTVDSGTWNGAWEFLVDGSKYELGTAASPQGFVENFWGGYGTGGDLDGNTGSGYYVPEPATLLLASFGLGLLRRRGRS